MGKYNKAITKRNYGWKKGFYETQLENKTAICILSPKLFYKVHCKVRI